MCDFVSECTGSRHFNILFFFPFTRLSSSMCLWSPDGRSWAQLCFINTHGSYQSNLSKNTNVCFLFLLLLVCLSLPSLERAPARNKGRRVSHNSRALSFRWEETSKILPETSRWFFFAFVNMSLFSLTLQVHWCPPATPQTHTLTLTSTHTLWEEKKNWLEASFKSAKTVSEAFTYKRMVFYSDNNATTSYFSLISHEHVTKTHSLLETTLRGHAWTWAWTFSDERKRRLWPKTARKKYKINRKKQEANCWRTRTDVFHSQTLALYGLFFPPGPAVMGCTMWFFF